jgi:flagellar biosynthetic protein FliQ
MNAMTIDQAAELGRAAVILALLISAPVLLAAALVGLVTSALQAVTQLHDQTLSFVPKIVAMLLALVWIFPWALQRMVEYSVDLYRGIPSSVL